MVTINEQIKCPICEEEMKVIEGEGVYYCANDKCEFGGIYSETEIYTMNTFIQSRVDKATQEGRKQVANRILNTCYDNSEPASVFAKDITQLINRELGGLQCIECGDKGFIHYPSESDIGLPERDEPCETCEKLKLNKEWDVYIERKRIIEILLNIARDCEICCDKFNDSEEIIGLRLYISELLADLSNKTYRIGEHLLHDH